MRREKWLVQAKKADFNALAQKYHINPVTARIIRNRDNITEDDYQNYLYGDETGLHAPWQMKDMETAVEILITKITEKKHIRIIGDYDIDGVCSTYILTDGLEAAGAVVSMDIPDRIKDGYGINEHLIDKAWQDGVDTIVTCDNGIAAIEQIAYAKELGMTVIVTDHHEIPYEETEQGRRFLRVNADATINPKQPDCGYPYKLLCGGAVAYKLIQALYARLGRIPDQAGIILEKYIVFAAIATIGDVVDLTGENRILAKLGLNRIAGTNNNGLLALAEANALDLNHITSYHIGFVLGPCLNAGGRLETAKLSFGLFYEKDPSRAAETAKRLKELNDKRKEYTEEGVEFALQECEKYGEDKILVLYLPKVHESIAGIIAGRVREKLWKPVIILTRAEEGVKGSARSIEGCNIFEELTGCRELLDRFGGHEMAAGLSLKEENIEKLRTMLNHKTALTDEDLIPKVWIDTRLPFEYITNDFVEELSLLEPFGKGNEKPVFAEKDVSIAGIRIIGKNKDSLKLTLLSGQHFPMPALIFRKADEFLSEIEKAYGKEQLRAVQIGLTNSVRMSIIYYPQVNVFRGIAEKQIIINNYCFSNTSV